jgi:protein-S-isoprenylcysteine O-methyltransferase Ste14
MRLQYLIIAISIIWLISEIILAIAKKSHAQQHDSHDKSSLRILWITISVAVTGGVFIGSSQIGLIDCCDPWISYTGLGLIIFGLIIRWIAIITLRQYFTVDIAVQPGQTIIKRGLYNRIRHPSYSGSLLSFLGLGLSFSNWFSTLIIFIPIFAAFYYRISIEEKALIKIFGSDYEDYRNNTAMLIPRIF